MFTIKALGRTYRDDNYRKVYLAEAHAATCPRGEGGRAVDLPDADEVDDWLRHFATFYANEVDAHRIDYGDCGCLLRRP
ncbi:hypothetical protein [Glycomyces sp. NPDC048151]|uniref:hypothetical protein n=1 Tax=Glycomyces sp. NPDC048151 TaxID=3364002 RepID=UPI003720CBBC